MQIITMPEKWLRKSIQTGSAQLATFDACFSLDILYFNGVQTGSLDKQLSLQTDLAWQVQDFILTQVHF